MIVVDVFVIEVAIVTVSVIVFIAMSIGEVTVTAAAAVGNVGTELFDAIKIVIFIIAVAAVVVVTGETFVQVPSRFPSIEFCVIGGIIIEGGHWHIIGGKRRMHIQSFYIRVTANVIIVNIICWQWCDTAVFIQIIQNIVVVLLIQIIFECRIFNDVRV